MLRDILTVVICFTLLICTSAGVYGAVFGLPTLVTQVVVALVLVVIVFTTLIIYGVKKADMSWE